MDQFGMDVKFDDYDDEAVDFGELEELVGEFPEEILTAEGETPQEMMTNLENPESLFDMLYEEILKAVDEDYLKQLVDNQMGQFFESTLVNLSGQLHNLLDQRKKQI